MTCENRSRCWRFRAQVVAAILFLGTRVWAVLAVSEPVSAADDLPPAPPSHISAVDVPDDGGGSITVTWVLSPDDRITFVGPSVGSFVIGTGSQTIRRERGIRGYRIYRLAFDQTPVELAVVEAGVGHFADDDVLNGIEYTYDVRAFDGSNNEGAAQYDAGSAADAARKAMARDDSTLPVDDSGAPILGWFNRADATIGLDDFFLFADHFGRTEGEIDFDAQFDLNDDFKIDLGDFFIFADHFGRTVANFAEIGDG